MLDERQQLHRLIDQLSDVQLPAALRFIEFLLSQEAPIDPEMLARIDAARANPSPGVPHEEILREYGL